ncbi:DUF5412 family protein [Paenibacillus tepidiphilus]|uniref:DUF5412 family protein n=1 Tax=Paenibacillus tepidiphilus TaxID=2608683 RepID=UPI001238E0FB|nr:DUF5412 family protein [Paenibacillus tepidiphilus]
MRKYNWSAFLSVLVLYAAIGYSLYARWNDQWRIAPPVYVLLILAVIVLIAAIRGFRDKSSWFAKFRSWFSTVLSTVLVGILSLVLLLTAVFSGAKEHLTTVHSPDAKYTINFYATDSGAMGSFGVVGELKGPLWLKKNIYYEDKANQVETHWENNHTLLINGHSLNVAERRALIVQ